MARAVRQSTLDYLATTKHVNLAMLISLEIPGTDGQYLNITDYGRNVYYNGIDYVSGKLKSISDIIRTHKLTANTVNIKLSGAPEEEIMRAIGDGSYLYRKVSVTRAIILEDGSILPYYQDGDSQLLFSGTTTEISIDEQASTTGVGSSVITWKCANEFYNLEQVNGRITDDASHRGLVVSDTGEEIPSTAAKKLEYQEDTGFFHSNQSINVLATYQTEEKRQKLKKKSKWGGLKTEYSMVDYWVTVTKEVDIAFNLAAKYIPVCYGVQKIDGIPVFADTLADDPNKVYVIYAFCEGEIEGFYDIWLDGKPMICFDADDTEDRTCFGQKREVGDTMGIATISAGGESTIGSVHEREYILEDGDGTVRMWTYHGITEQSAADVLVDIAAAGDFYGQTSLGVTQGPSYWDSNSILSDTAYVVMEFNMTDERTDIPTISAEVKGRKVAVFDNGGLVNSNSTSTNTAWQILDYLRSPIFGAGVSLDRIDTASFIRVADLFDTLDTSYETSWAPYWRYIGWDSPNDGSNRSVIQTNSLLETDSSVFKNMQSLLDQTVCSLNIVNGEYTLTVEAESQDITVVPYEDIIDGKVTVSDVTSKNKFNSVSAGIPDPGNGWQNTEVTFFDGEYLEEDLYVDKKLTMNFPHMTNYYTARSLAERELRKSRFNREVKVTLPFKYSELQINNPLHLSYPRFGWVDKEFLIRQVSIKANGRVDVTLREYSEGIFINSTKVDKGSVTKPQIPNLVKPPRNASYVPSDLLDNEDKYEGKQGELRWERSFTTDVTYYSVQIEGVAAAYIIEVDQFDPADPYFKLDISGLPIRDYVVQIRAVAGARGQSSSPLTTVMEVRPTISMHAVTGLHITNPSSKSNSVWVGEAPLIAWDELDTVQYGYVNTPAKYELQILDSSGALLTEYITTINSGTYPLADNVADYLLHFNSAGAYRNISVRVRGFTDSGAQSIDWTTL